MLVVLIIIHHILFIDSMEIECPSSFLEVDHDHDFPLENIPFGVISPKQQPHNKFIATRIGDWAINLKQLQNNGYFNGPLLSGLGHKIFQGEYLNDFMALTRPYWQQARTTIQALFSNSSTLAGNQQFKEKHLLNIAEVVNHLPAKIGDYTDFYSSRAHAFNVGSIIRGPANALQQNWLHIPIGYHGRASSIVVSGTPLRRPRGQVKGKDATEPTLSDCKRLDFEIEVGAFVGGTTNELGKPLKVNEAWNNIFGFVVLNDWSFRDFQTWEYVPLGPFTAKNGMSTISPWIVTLEALQGSEVALSEQEPKPLQYLQQKQHKSYNIELSLLYKTPKMEQATELVKTNFKYMYWSSAQQLAHHALTGCNMQVGDMLGSGTISGPQKHQFGSLLQLSWGGRDDIPLPNGQVRKFILDGDSINIRGRARRNGKNIGFGDCEGTVLPAWSEAEYY